MSEMRLYPHRGPRLLHANDAFVSSDGNSGEKMSTLENGMKCTHGSMTD